MACLSLLIGSDFIDMPVRTLENNKISLKELTKNAETVLFFLRDASCVLTQAYIRDLIRSKELFHRAGVGVVEADKRKLDAMSATHSHQGVIAAAAAAAYASLEDILQRAADRGESPLLVVCDEISDPHNLGAIIRTAECAGAHGVIIPKRRSAGLTAVVAKTSAGAVSYLPVARVPNLTAALKRLKEEGLWVFGTAADGGTSLYQADLKGPAVLVIGSEGDGMGRLVQEGCDFLVSIPMGGRISSLNASAAAAVLLYEAVRQRR